MITFLPVPSFEETAKILDYRRLGKQRVEALMILRILDPNYHSINGKISRWTNHPATKMWIGYEKMLQEYTLAMCDEWIGRGYKDTISPEIASFKFTDDITPPWIGSEKFHLSHQSNLVRKVPGYYGPIFPGVADNLPYFWPG